MNELISEQVQDIAIKNGKAIQELTNAVGYKILLETFENDYNYAAERISELDLMDDAAKIRSFQLDMCVYKRFKERVKILISNGQTMLTLNEEEY